jgi:hypothetical protein
METFVVRVWAPAEPEGAGPRLRGLLEHIRDGERRPFDGASDLIAQLESAVAASIQESGRERTRPSNDVPARIDSELEHASDEKGTYA